MDKQNMAYPYSGLLAIIKENEVLMHAHATTYMNLKTLC